MKKNKKGVALMMVLGVMALLTILTIELTTASSVERRLTMNQRERLQAYYLARSGINFALLRINLWIKGKNELETSKCGSGGAAAGILQAVAQNLDQVWSMPLPALPLPEMKATWPGTVSVHIESEGSKIPINLLDGNEHRGSDSKIQEDVKKQFLELFNFKRQDEKFDDKYRDIDPEDLINSIIDWVDEDSNKVEGGDENSEYERRKPPYKSKNNRMNSITELYMLEHWNDSIVNDFINFFSVLKTKAQVNPNTLSFEWFKSLNSDFDGESFKLINERRMSQPFGSMQELQDFIQTEISDLRNFKFPQYMIDNSTLDHDLLILKSNGRSHNAVRTLKVSVRILREMAKPVTGTPPKGGETICKCGSSGKDLCKIQEPQIVMIEDVL